MKTGSYPNPPDPPDGSVAISPGGSFVYTPDQGFNGTDSFTYTVSDGELTDTATVTVFVAEATDSPLVASGGVTTLDDVRRLVEMKMPAAIVGRAIYDGAMKLDEVLREAGDLPT